MKNKYKKEREREKKIKKEQYMDKDEISAYKTIEVVIQVATWPMFECY